MSSHDYYKVTYDNKSSNARETAEHLDNDTEFNANQFKLYDDFNTDLRINYNTMRNSMLVADIERRCQVARRNGDPNDSGVDMENGNPLDDAVTANDSDLLENEVMVDTWSSMDSTNSPLTDSGASASEDCTPSTSSEPPRAPSPTQNAEKLRFVPKPADKPSRDLTLQLDPLETAAQRRPHFLDEDYKPPTKSNIECRIPKPHFLDQSPSPDGDITNPNFLDDDILEGDDAKKSGALPKRPQKPVQEERPKINYRSTLHYGLDSVERSSERDKRASQLYRGTWPGERDWAGQDTASVRSFSSNGSANAPRASSNLENKMDCVYSLLSLLTLSPDNNADLSGPLLDMSRSGESCVAMRQAGCIPLLVQLIHSNLPRDTRDRAAKALRNIIHTQTDDKAGRREARVWRLLEQVREYCYTLEDAVEGRKAGKEVTEEETTKHPTQSVAALMKLSFDEEHRHVVCQLGGLQALAALVREDQAAHGSAAEEHACLTMRKYAGMTLTNLTFGDGNNKSLLCSFKQFMLALVDQLESPNDDMRQVTAAVLRNLSWRADSSSKQILREVGAVKGLTTAAMTCQKEATLKSVLSALWNLTAHCSMNKVALCSVDGALGFLVDMLSYNSPTKTLAIIENAGGIMRNVSSHIAVREDYRQILRERNCLSVLLQHLKSPSLTVVSNSCGTLWNLSARCPHDQQYLWDHGAVPMLRSLIHSKHKMIAMGSSAALKNLLNSKPGKTHIVSLDTTARNMNLPALPTLGARKQKALEQELDQNLAETCDNIEPATSPMTSNREEKNLFTATERQIAMNLERHRMTSSSPLMGALSSQISLSHSAHLASYLSCSNTLLKGAATTRSSSVGGSSDVNRSDSKDSVTSTHSDSVFERVQRTGKVPIPTPRNRDLVKNDPSVDAFKMSSNSKDGYTRYSTQPPVPPPRSTDMRTNYTESGYDVDQDSCDQPIDYSRKYSETKTSEPSDRPTAKPKPAKKTKKENPDFGDYQETDLDQPTDYSLRYAEHHSESGSDASDPPPPSVNEDTIKHFATEGTPYETPIIFSTATSMSDLRVIGKEGKPKSTPNIKEDEVMTHSDEKDTCSIDDTPHHDNDRAVENRHQISDGKRFDTKFNSGTMSPEKPVNYCDEGTPGCFSRVSSLSSLGEPTEEDCLAKRNAMATINMEHSFPEQSSSAKDKEVSKAVTFASEPAGVVASVVAGVVAGGTEPSSTLATPGALSSRCSSPGSLPDCRHHDLCSTVSEVSRLTSGCISPSELPDSPGQQSVRVTPPPHPLTHSLLDHAIDIDINNIDEPQSVFEERATTFVVENTPAYFSTATSLSNLSFDDEPKQIKEVMPRCQETSADAEPQRIMDSDGVIRSQAHLQAKNDTLKETHTPGADSCMVFFTEDTPAILSKAGSNSNLSVLSIISNPGGQRGEEHEEQLGARLDIRAELDIGTRVDHREMLPKVDLDTSDSSNLSDADGLLEQCIQKGIAQVVKNKGPPSESGSAPYHHATRDGPYRSLPPYLRSSTETVKMSLDFANNIRESPPPPPLPPRVSVRVPPPRPPALISLTSHTSHTSPASLTDRREGRKHESRLPVKQPRDYRDRPRLPPAPDLVRADSLSSLSLDSFGSTDREIFEKTIKAGLSSLNKADDTKAHSVERPIEPSRNNRQHKSLDRSDKIVPHRRKRDCDADKRKPKRSEDLAQHISRSPFSYHGDTSNSLAYRLRGRFRDDGPPSLPARVDRPKLERSNSLSSLSNDSFGSTDKEAFERCVRKGMTELLARDEGKLRVRSDDRLEVRDHRKKISTNRKRPEQDFAGTKMTRSPFSYHGDTLAMSLAHTRGTRHGDGPASLPSRVEGTRQVERTNSLSSLSNCSFGSTDREVFERCVRKGMTRGMKEEEKRVRSDDRLEVREPYRSRRRRTEVHNESRVRVSREERSTSQSKNVQTPSPASAHGDGDASLARIITHQRSGCDRDSAIETTVEHLTDNESDLDTLDRSNEQPTVDSGNTTLESTDANDMDRSNEFLAPKSLNTTLESDVNELNRSNESYADVLDGSFSDFGSPPKNVDAATLTRKNKLEWTEIKNTDGATELDEVLKRSADTWNDNTCPDDVTFPTISGSVHMISSFKSDILDASNALPDLLEKSGSTMSFSRPDLTNRLDRTSPESSTNNLPSGDKSESEKLLYNVPEPSFISLVDDSEARYDSILSTAIEKEAARLAAQLKCSQYGMDHSVTSLNSLDLDNVKPPSNLGSLLSLSASGQWDDSSTSKKSQKIRKKSLPHALLVKKALTNSYHHEGSEHLEGNPVSFLEHVNPPSEMEHINDMESSMLSVSSIASDIVELKDKPPVVFDFKQPVQEFPMYGTLTTVYHDLDSVNPPSLFDEMAESTTEVEATTTTTTARLVHADCVSTLHVVTDLPSGSETCTPLPSDLSSVDSTPERRRDTKHLTAKEKRRAAKDRYQTYTLNDPVSESDVTIECDTHEFLTWTKSESDSRSEECVTAHSDTKPRKRVSAKQRRMDDRARYLTQTVNIDNIIVCDATANPQVESLKQRLADKKTMKQKRVENAERFRTRTLSEDIPPSPTFVTRDANFENVETTTGYDSLSSNEPGHQLIEEVTHARDQDSGHNDDDLELNSTRMQSYTKSFRNYLPVMESPTAVDMCIVNNLKNIEMTASYRRALQTDFKNNPSSGDFASYEGDSHSERAPDSGPEPLTPPARPKPKITKPDPKRDDSLDSNDSRDKDDSPKAIRGRKKALYVSPYRRNAAAIKPAAAASKVTPKSETPKLNTPKPMSTIKAASANTSPKKAVPKSSVKTPQKPASIKPLPLERQGTFTKEESTVPAGELPAARSKVTRVTKAVTATKTNTSPSRLPQLSRYTRPPLKKTSSVENKQVTKKTTPRSAMKNSASNHSLQSNDSGKTVTLNSRSSRQGSTSSVNSAPAKKDIESKIAGLWKKVEQSKRVPTKPDRRVWIEGEKTEPPRLIRSSTFEGQPKQQVSTAPKQKTTIGIRVTQIPSLKPKTQVKTNTQTTTAIRKTTGKVFGKKQLN